MDTQCNEAYHRICGYIRRSIKKATYTCISYWESLNPHIANCMVRSSITLHVRTVLESPYLWLVPSYFQLIAVVKYGCFHCAFQIFHIFAGSVWSIDIYQYHSRPHSWLANSRLGRFHISTQMLLHGVFNSPSVHSWKLVGAINYAGYLGPRSQSSHLILTQPISWDQKCLAISENE